MTDRTGKNIFSTEELALLETICSIHGPSGDEEALRDFILNHVQSEMHNWAVKPEIIVGKGLQNNLILVFGQPRTAIFSHMDTIGFTVRYDNSLIRIGGPMKAPFTLLRGADSQGEVIGALLGGDQDFSIDFDRTVDPGTDLTFHPDFRCGSRSIQSPYLDDRMGCWLALLIARTLRNGAICFSTWEENGGGAAGYLGAKLYDELGVSQALILDMTYVTEGIRPGRGPVISLRDRSIPRKCFVNRILSLAREADIDFQIEVESSGGSDGSELQTLARPIDWCFIGVPEENYHSPDEKANIQDVASALKLYQVLMEKL